MKPSLEELSETVRQRTQWIKFHPPYLSETYNWREIQLRKHNEDVANGFRAYWLEQQESAQECGLSKLDVFEAYNDSYNHNTKRWR